MADKSITELIEKIKVIAELTLKELKGYKIWEPISKNDPKYMAQISKNEKILRLVNNNLYDISILTSTFKKSTKEIDRELECIYVFINAIAPHFNQIDKWEI
jgi:hypothetical protein